MSTRPVHFSKNKRQRFSAFLASLTCTAFCLSLFCPFAWAADGALEALELRTHAEKAIAEERSSELAQAMRESLPGLLQEYLATRDGTIALDVVDDTFVHEQFKIARAMEEPGVALALDVFTGPGTEHENELRVALSNLADFHSDLAERAAERSLGDREISDAKIDAFERQMERGLENVLHQLVRDEMKSGQIDARFEALIQARLDSVLGHLGPSDPEEKEERAQRFAEAAAHFAEVAKSMAGGQPENAEKLSAISEAIAEKVIEQTVERVVERVLTAEQQARRAEFLYTAERLSSAAEQTTSMGEARYVDLMAHAERARGAAEMLTQQSAARQTELLGYVDKFTQIGDTATAAGFQQYAEAEKVRYDVEIQKNVDLAAGFDAFAPQEKARFDAEAAKLAADAQTFQQAADQI